MLKDRIATPEGLVFAGKCGIVYPDNRKKRYGRKLQQPAEVLRREVSTMVVSRLGKPPSHFGTALPASTVRRDQWGFGFETSRVKGGARRDGTNLLSWE